MDDVTGQCCVVLTGPETCYFFVNQLLFTLSGLVVFTLFEFCGSMFVVLVKTILSTICIHMILAILFPQRNVGRHGSGLI